MNHDYQAIEKKARTRRTVLRTITYLFLVFWGLVVLFPEPLNPKAVAVLTGNQMAPEKAATEGLTAEDVEEGTLVLAMTAREAAQVREDYPGASLVYTLGDFAGKPGDVEEPHGGTLAEYGACCEYIDLLVKLAVERLLRIREKQKAAAANPGA